MKDSLVNITHCVIIGSSTGLGAALVSEYMRQTAYQIIGVGRTALEELKQHYAWSLSGRYQHLKLDISSSACVSHLQALCTKFNAKPICLIFNAARVASDINQDGSIDYEILKEVNRVGIEGFVNVLTAFGEYLASYGGIFVGISSFSAFVPPLAEPRIAYPASKAYLDMALRSLRVVWSKRVKVVIVHLGHMDSRRDKSKVSWMAPSYTLSAKKIVASLTRKNIRSEINYPLSYCILYKYFFKLLPDSVYFILLRLIMAFARV